MMLPGAVQAQFNYTINANLTITITGYTGLGGSVSIPGMINGLPVTSIGDSAFAGSSVTNIMIPNSATNFGPAAFGGCGSLLAINVDQNNGYYSSAGGVLFDKIQSTLILYPYARAGEYTIPSGVTTVASGAFSNCTALSSLTLPGTITTLGDYACQGCTVRSITIPDSVTNVGGNAFYSCRSLTNATIGNSVANIGSAAFGYCASLTDLRLGTGIVNIPDSAFEYCTSLSSVAIPNNVTNIGGGAFYSCRSLTNATIGTSVVNIGDQAFIGCTQLNTVTIPDNVTNIGSEAFAHCVNLTNATIGKGVLNIGWSAFAFCAFNAVTIPNAVIGNGAFAYCSNLTTVTLGENVTSIGGYTFAFCPSLAEVYFLGSAPVADSQFDGSDLSIIYYLPGTMGWGTTFAGRPAVPINIQIQIDDSFGVHTNRFGFNIVGSYGLIVVVEATTSLRNPIWHPLQTNTLGGGSFYFSDPQWTDYPQRFYRLRWLP